MPATLALTLGAPGDVRRLHAGRRSHLRRVHDRHRHQHRGRRGADRPTGGTLANGAFSLAEPLQVELQQGHVDRHRSPTTPVTIAFKQHIGATEPLRTGAYSKTLTFTLSTTTP